jgi:heme-degrading monooxygenase HmoA
MHANITYLSVENDRLDDYLAMRRTVVNPAMRDWPGSAGSVLLRRREAHGQGRIGLALVNLWETAETQREWETSRQHVGLRSNHDSFVCSRSDGTHRRLEDISVTVGVPAAAGMVAIGIHHVSGGRIQEYLARRRDIVHPSMSNADGFIGCWVLTDPDDPSTFICLFWWRDDAAVDTYSNIPEHRGPVYNAVRSVTEGPIASTRYDVVPVDDPWGALAGEGR